jgi:membrane protease YdiL (CAAX protease family)
LNIRSWTFDYDPATAGAPLALLATPILLTLWRYEGMARNYDARFGTGTSGTTPGLSAYLYEFGAFFVLMFVVPVLLLRRRPRRSLAELGLGWGGSPRAAVLTVLAAAFVVVPMAWLAAGMPAVRETYPLFRALFQQPALVLPYEAAYVLLFYVAWEAFFRGYLLFTLEAEYGAAAAILIQTMASCLVHIGHPESEILGAIPAGIVFGMIALRTRSIWPTFLLHATLGVLTDLFVLAR